MQTAKSWICSALFFLVTTVLCGVIYTGVVTGAAQALFPHEANGSIIEVDGVKYGSEVVGQQFTGETHMWGRIMNPNAGTFTDNEGNPVMWYGPSNLSPASDEFDALVAQRVAEIRAAHPEKVNAPIPSDLVTCSGSGLDPHISPAAAEYQVDRLARANGIAPAEVRTIIELCTEQPQLGILGDPCVNVLKVNLMLDGILPVE